MEIKFHSLLTWREKMINNIEREDKEIEAIQLIDMAENLVDKNRGEEAISCYEEAVQIYLDIFEYHLIIFHHLYLNLKILFFLLK